MTRYITAPVRCSSAMLPLCIIVSFCASVGLLRPCTAAAQLTQRELRRIAHADVTEGAVSFERPYTRVAGDTLEWGLGYATLQIPAEDDSNAVRAQYEVEVLRNCREQWPGILFWTPVLVQVEAVIQEELEYRAATASPDSAVIERYRDRISGLYEDKIKTYAALRGLKSKRIESKGFKICKVVFQTDAASSIQLVGRTTYRLRSAQGKTVTFDTYANGEQRDIPAGRYMYRIGDVGTLREKPIMTDGTYSFPR